MPQFIKVATTDELTSNASPLHRLARSPPGRCNANP
jgi:hypothetical protein